jgi:hypothetical protein
MSPVYELQFPERELKLVYLEFSPIESDVSGIKTDCSMTETEFNFVSC